MKANYTIYVNGWWYEDAYRLDEAIEKAKKAATSPSTKEIELYEAATKKTLHKWTKIN